VHTCNRRWTQCQTRHAGKDVLGEALWTMISRRALALRFSGSSCLPAYPGFIVMKKPTRGSRGTVLPSVKTNDFLCSRTADSTQLICGSWRRRLAGGSGAAKQWRHGCYGEAAAGQQAGESFREQTKMRQASMQQLCPGSPYSNICNQLKGRQLSPAARTPRARPG
jgi:hypothetical protein